MTKTVLIQFAKPNIETSSHVDEIQEAIKKANANLYGRFNIWISYQGQVKNGFFVKMESPDEKEISCIGRRLRGISQYLLKHYPIYRDYLVGCRLFLYHDITLEKEVTE